MAYQPSSSSDMEMSDVLDYEAIERRYDEYDHERETFMEDGDDEPRDEVEPEDLDDETTERLYDEYDHENEMHVRNAYDRPLEEEGMESDDLDDERIERIYDEHDHEIEMFVEDEDDEPQEGVEPEDLDDETVERLYDEYDNEKRMKDEHDGLLEEEKAQRYDDYTDLSSEMVALHKQRDFLERGLRTITRRLMFQGMQHHPRELRDMVYEKVFEDSYIKLEAEQNEEVDPTHHPWGCSIKPRSCISYGDRIDFELYAADAANDAMKLELAQAWYETTTFWTTDPSTIASSLSRFKWSAGLEKEPLDLIKHVEIWIPVENPRDTAKETTILKRFESLFQLNKQTIITIALQDLCSFMVFNSTGNVTNILGLEDYAPRVEYLLEPLARLRGAGYKVIVRAEQGLNFVVEPEETNLEEWTKKIRAAIIEGFPYRSWTAQAGMGAVRVV